MAYVPNPADVTRPTDADPAESAQAEFRALKAYIAGLAGLNSGANLFATNKIINGDPILDQRNVGVALVLTAADVYGPDRWYARRGAGVTSSFRQIASTVAGFYKQLKYDITVGAAPGAADLNRFGQILEGIDCVEMQYGTATALSGTLSFVANSTQAGVHCGRLVNSAGTRSYVFTFNVALANVNQLVTVTIPGDTAGVWLVDKGVNGIQLDFDMGCGVNFETAVASVWVATNSIRIPAAVQLSTGVNTFKVTGVQFKQEAGASPWSPALSAILLLRAQRFYEKSYSIDVVPGTADVVGQLSSKAVDASVVNSELNGSFKTTKCKVPTVHFYSTVSGAIDRVRDINAGVDKVVNATTGTGQTITGYPSYTVAMVASDTHTAQYTADAELTPV